MARKVFISILGTGPYSECKYSVNETHVLTTRYIQLATLKYLVDKSKLDGNEWTENDEAIIFLTDKAKSDQWQNGYAREGKETLIRDGLEKEFYKMSFPFELTPKDIKDGKDTDEIWEIFDVIYNEINDGDELFLDITHAFRSH